MALAFGIPSVSHLKSMLTSKELTDWFAFYSIEPFGQERLDILCGILATVIAKTSGGKKAAKLTPLDFIPDWWEEKEERERQTDMAEQINFAKMMAAAYGGEVTDGS